MKLFINTEDANSDMTPGTVEHMYSKYSPISTLCL